jgi:hypothetical protein
MQINFDSSSSFIEFVNRNGAGAKEFRFYYGASGVGFAFLSSSGAWTNASDARIKKNIKDIKYGLQTVMLLNPREYDLKQSNKHAIGFVAQEVLDIIPEVVHGSENSQFGIDYGSITAILTKAMQEQQAVIDDLKARIEALEG